jgi:hypothetical protein
LGIQPPVAKVRISETLDDSNFNIEDYYSPEEIAAFYEVQNQLLDLSDVHGPAYVKPALTQLGEAGSSGAWRVLAATAAQNADYQGVKEYAWLGVQCASNNWDVLVSMQILASEIGREISASKANLEWEIQSPHPLREDVVNCSDLLRRVIGDLYPNSEQLQSYMDEDVENTRQILAEAGVALYSIHQVFGTDGHRPGHVGIMALGLALLIDFGPPQQSASAEVTLKNLVTIQGKFADFAQQILEIEQIKPKLMELGVWRWS